MYQYRVKLESHSPAAVKGYSATSWLCIARILQGAFTRLFSTKKSRRSGLKDLLGIETLPKTNPDHQIGSWEVVGSEFTIPFQVPVVNR